MWYRFLVKGRFSFGPKNHRVSKSDFLEKNIYPLRNAIGTHKTLYSHSIYFVYLDSLLGWHREVSQMSSAHATNHMIPKFEFLEKIFIPLEML